MQLADPSVAAPAKFRLRHFMICLSFIVMVLAPAAVACWYLYTQAVDQYASTVGFTVRKQDTSSTIELIGGITSLSSADISDAEILYEFIHSQDLVETLQAKIDLRSLYSKPENDPVFAFDAEKPIEDLQRYWQRMVKIIFDNSTGLMELRVLAFAPKDAQLIASQIFKESTQKINQINAVAREDTTKYAKAELDFAEERLKIARQNITIFRSTTQLVDPEKDIQGQQGLLNTLQEQLAEALIELDLLREVTTDADPRIAQSERKIRVIEARIDAERQKIGLTDSQNETYSTKLGEYETLTVDREFAETTYLAALKSYDEAQAEALQQSRYLAAYINPTLAQSAQYPKRLILFSTVTVFVFLLWVLSVLIFYGLRERY